MGFEPFLALSASAGSGKTFALSVRYIGLLFLGEPPSSILAATFTNKAAAEMRQRVVDLLQRFDENRSFVEALSMETGLDIDELLRRKKTVLERFLASPSYIVTLDSFFVNALRSGALEIGLEPDFRVREENSRDIDSAFLEELHREGLLGTLVGLALQMQKRHAGEMTETVRDMYRLDPLLPDWSRQRGNPAELDEKIEKLCSLLRDRVGNAGGSKSAVANFAFSSVEQLYQKSVFAKETLFEHSYYKKALAKDPVIEELYQELKESVREWMIRKEAAVLSHIFELYTHYRNARIALAKSSGVFGFDDLGFFAYRLLYESISRDFFYFRLDARFRHILLDEFQDTSTLQFLLLKPMVDEIFAGRGQQEFRSFFYVGDTKQSLYRFRGGTEELFDWVADNYGIEIRNLESNYRSCSIIVEQVNRWFEKIMPGYIRQKSHKKDEGYLKVAETEDLLESAVKEAQRLMAAGADCDDIAFLVNTNKDGADLQELCEKAGIPTRLQTSSSLRTQPRTAALVKMAEYLYRREEIDAAALLQRTGIRSPEEPDLSWYRPWISPLELIDRLVRIFNYYENDPNILRLMEFSAQFDTLAEFLEEFDNSRISMADRTSHGVRILTIHGSKGLEFDNVIVLDRLKRSSADRSPLLFCYDDKLHVEKIMYRMKNRDRFDPEYADILKERRVFQEKDHLNVLYVALTRAARALIVLKKPENSIFDPISLEPVEMGVYRAGERKTEERKSAPVKVDLCRYGTQESPEKTEEKEEGDFGARLFGTAMHYALEMMTDFEPSSVSSAVTALRNRYGALLASEEIADIERRISALAASGSWHDRLKGAVLSREQPLTFGGKFKQIDLLLEWPERAEVIDYKSSEKFAHKHREQVAEYVEALGEILQKPVKGTIVYLLENDIRLESVY